MSEYDLVALSAIVQSNLDDAERRVDENQGDGEMSRASWLQAREAVRNFTSIKSSMQRLGLWVEPPVTDR